MRAVLRLVAHEFSARWRGWVLLGLLVGVAGGAVLTAVAGARRTDSAYPRFLVASRAADVLVSPFNTGLDGYYRALAQLPDVAVVAPLVGLNVIPLRPDGRPAASGTVAVPADGRFGHQLEIPKLLAGRLPRPDRPGEVAVSQIGASSLHLHVGSTLVLGACAGQVCNRANTRRPRERVAGIFVARGSVVPVTDLDKLAAMFASTALFDQLVHQLGPGIRGFDGAYVKLRPGVSPERFTRQAQALARQLPGTGGQVFVADEAAQAATIERSIRPQALALAIFAMVLAISALLIVGYVASRLLFAGSSDYPTLAALGMTRGQLLTAGLAEVGAVAMAGAGVAAGAAVAASPLMPIGAARLAEPSPGVSADATVLAAGAAMITALMLARAAWPAWRLASAARAEERAPAAATRRSLAAWWLAGAGAPVTAVTGVRLALEPGRGRSAMPVGSALAGTALPVLAVAAAFTFGANLLHLVHSPRLYGQSWDVAIDLQFQAMTPQQTQQLAGRAAGVSSWSVGNHGSVGINGQIVPAIGVAPGRGPLVSPTLLSGHPPRTDHQIVLGTSVLRRIGRTVGQLVTVTVNGHRQQDRIVGRAVFPNFGQGSFTPTDLGLGAETTAAFLKQAFSPGGGPHYDFVLLRFAPGPHRATNIASFTKSMAGFCGTVQQSTCLVTDQRPNGITNYLAIDGTPEVLAVLLAVLGLAVLGQLIVMSGRRRRRDFAIMKALGLLRRQVRWITAWQITTLTMLALLIGLPAGVALGRWAWALFATGLGIAGGTVTPVPIVLLMVPAAVLAANAVAFWPARRTARLSPAEVLHAE